MVAVKERGEEVLYRYLYPVGLCAIAILSVNMLSPKMADQIPTTVSI